jgi:hypothetical protein
MYELGLQLIPALAPQLESFDALELHSCGITPPPFSRPHRELFIPDGGSMFYVDYKRGSDGSAGNKAAPFKTIAKGISAARDAMAKPVTVILKAGVHFLNDTIQLGPKDSGLTITADKDAQVGDVWVSGGIPLTTAWSKVPGSKSNIWVTEVEENIGTTLKGLNMLGPNGDHHDSDGLFGRLTKARYPNGDPELCTDCWKSEDLIKDWHADVSCVGKGRVVYKDLRGCVGTTGKLPDGSPCKADSAMWDSYNTYTNGHGGCCAVWEGDESPYGKMGSYYCGNSSAGGWVGYNVSELNGQWVAGKIPSAMIYTVYSTLYSIQYTIHYYTVYTIHYTLLHSIQYTIHYYTVYTIHYTLLHSIQYTLYTITQYTLYTIHYYTVYSAHILTLAA